MKRFRGFGMAEHKVQQKVERSFTEAARSSKPQVGTHLEISSDGYIVWDGHIYEVGFDDTLYAIGHPGDGGHISFLEVPLSTLGLEHDQRTSWNHDSIYLESDYEQFEVRPNLDDGDMKRIEAAMSSDNPNYQLIADIMDGTEGDRRADMHARRGWRARRGVREKFTGSPNKDFRGWRAAVNDRKAKRSMKDRLDMDAEMDDAFQDGDIDKMDDVKRRGTEKEYDHRYHRHMARRHRRAAKEVDESNILQFRRRKKPPKVEDESGEMFLLNDVVIHGYPSLEDPEFLRIVRMYKGPDMGRVSARVAVSFCEAVMDQDDGHHPSLRMVATIIRFKAGANAITSEKGGKIRMTLIPEEILDAIKNGKMDASRIWPSSYRDLGENAKPHRPDRGLESNFVYRDLIEVDYTPEEISELGNEENIFDAWCEAEGLINYGPKIRRAQEASLALAQLIWYKNQ